MQRLTRCAAQVEVGQGRRSDQDGEERSNHEERTLRTVCRNVSNDDDSSALDNERTEKRSRRTEKQNAHGTGRPSGARTTHCIVMDVAVDSNACLANDS